MQPDSPETRASLILRLKNAEDVAAWDEFVAIYGPLVYRLAQRQGLQAADADDLVQEVFKTVANSIASWLDRSDRGPFRAWLFRIARNTAVNQLTRRSTRSMAAGGGEVEQFLLDAVAPDGSLSEEFDLEYRREVFCWAANQIRESVTENTWRSFWATHVDQRPVAEVAAELGTSVGNVYVGRSRVMARMRELVKQFEDLS